MHQLTDAERFQRWMEDEETHKFFEALKDKMHEMEFTSQDMWVEHEPSVLAKMIGANTARLEIGEFIQ